ncbi:MAG: hypothetical protein FWD82_08345 [Defluviitaleaceae bacterium]|nr:hypothetical protein [Defluviitaleaceae bacterium]
MNNQEYCVKVCPNCDGNGNLLIVRNRERHDDIRISCDECMSEWSHPEISNANRLNTQYFTRADYDAGRGIEDATLEDIEKKGWLEYIYVFEDSKWRKYTDKSIVLF